MEPRAPASNPPFGRKLPPRWRSEQNWPCQPRRRNFVGQHFWAGGYWVLTVGKNEAAVHQYIQDQEKKTDASNNWRWWRFERLPILNNRFERFTLSQASGFAKGR
jgi:hypothetical protein